MKKHTQAVAECETRGRTSIVTTNPSAALMKFPDGAGLPGHRVSAVAAGMQARFVVAVLVTPDTNDYGLLEPIVSEAEKMLARIGVPPNANLQLAADAGYTAQSDLAFAERVRDRIDLLIDGAQAPEMPSRLFGRDRFEIRDDGSAVCPAGRPMKGPAHHDKGRTIWTGVGCGDCSLRSQCTDGRYRSLTANLELDRLRAAMQTRLDAPGGLERYHRRIATMEPVFANIESAMGYRRAGSRSEQTVVVEVLLKVLAHNISRLLAARPLSRVYWLVTPEGVSLLPGREFPADL